MSSLKCRRRGPPIDSDNLRSAGFEGSYDSVKSMNVTMRYCRLRDCIFQGGGVERSIVGNDVSLLHWWKRFQQLKRSARRLTSPHIALYGSTMIQQFAMLGIQLPLHPPVLASYRSADTRPLHCLSMYPGACCILLRLGLVASIPSTHADSQLSLIGIDRFLLPLYTESIFCQEIYSHQDFGCKCVALNDRMVAFYNWFYSLILTCP